MLNRIEFTEIDFVSIEGIGYGAIFSFPNNFVKKLCKLNLYTVSSYCSKVFKSNFPSFRNYAIILNVSHNSLCEEAKMEQRKT